MNIGDEDLSLVQVYFQSRHAEIPMMPLWETHFAPFSGDEVIENRLILASSGTESGDYSDTDIEADLGILQMSYNNYLTSLSASQILSNSESLAPGNAGSNNHMSEQLSSAAQVLPTPIVPCPFCSEKRFKRYCNLEKHIERDHDRQFQYRCTHNECRGLAEYTEYWAQKHHESQHKTCKNVVKCIPPPTELRKKKYWPCNVCPSVPFQTLHDFVKHYWSHGVESGDNVGLDFGILMTNLLSYTEVSKFWKLLSMSNYNHRELTWNKADPECQEVRKELENGFLHLDEHLQEMKMRDAVDKASLLSRFRF